MAARVALLEEHLSALVGSDLFVTGIINPLNEHPALPPSHLARLADAAKAQMEQAVSSSLAQRLQQLEAQAEQAAARSRRLEGEVLDLAEAGAQRDAQPGAAGAGAGSTTRRSEAPHARDGPAAKGGAGTPGPVRAARRRKYRKRKIQIDETVAMGSEVDSRAIRKAVADRITQQLDSLLVEETNEEEEGQEVGVSVDVKWEKEGNGDR